MSTLLTSLYSERIISYVSLANMNTSLYSFSFMNFQLVLLGETLWNAARTFKQTKISHVFAINPALCYRAKKTCLNNLV